MPLLKKTMFREYDIRGRESADELNDLSVYHIARGFAVMLKEKGIAEAIVGCDARGTSESFHKNAVKALLGSGISVVDIGTVTTPMSYWAQYHFKVRGLVMITASHNPVGWNGVKLGTNFSDTLLPAGIQELYKIIEKESYLEGKGKVRKESVKEGYINDLKSRTKVSKKLKVLVNTGNGTAGLYAPDLLRSAGYDVIEHYTEVDSTYPHYTPNPDGTEMMEDTGRQVLTYGADIGLAFDGDGDRLGVTDEKGNVIWPDRYLILLSRLVLKEHPGAKIVFDVKVSEALPEDIKAHGGVAIMWKTGHSYIKAKLAEEKAALAGEMSGHIFFAENFYGFDDGLFAALKMLEYLGGEKKPLSELIALTPYYLSTPTIQVPTTDEAKYDIVNRITERFASEGYAMVTINGARVYMEGGWGLVRASSNTPTIVLRFEAKNEAALKRIQDIFKNQLHREGVVGEWNTSGN